ncbi:MAG TPA: RNA 2',3'-cyclic phosphodiesterase [Pilimelia sp.]|nr:RNA 2',3'-cyclic phosphodiesterase [Pilimelia sp.]
MTGGPEGAGPPAAGPATVRLFVAVDPPPAATRHLAAHVDTLAVAAARGRGVNPRLVPPDRWHLTVAFLGEVAAARQGDAAAAVAAGVSAWERYTAAGGGSQRPALRLAGGGRFGGGQATVLWVGVAGELDTVAHLARQVRAALRQARLPHDRKPFRPHLTLARPGTRVDVADDIAALDRYRGPVWSVTGLRLMRSQLGPTPRYTVVAEVPLPAPRGAGPRGTG